MLNIGRAIHGISKASLRITGMFKEWPSPGQDEDV